MVRFIVISKTLIKNFKNFYQSDFFQKYKEMTVENKEKISIKKV